AGAGDPCGRYVGGTGQSCPDTTEGFRATCCFAVGTIPVASGGGSSGGTDVPDGGRPTAQAGPGGGKGGGAGATTGTGGTTGGGAGGMTGGGVCAAGAACSTPGIRCGDA